MIEPIRVEIIILGCDKYHFPYFLSFSILFHLFWFLIPGTHIMADRAKGFLYTMSRSRIDE